MENEKLENLKKEVMDINGRILTACEADPKIKKLYKGCIVYLSPVYENTNIMFFGINPGAGHYNEHGVIIQEFDPQKTENHSGYGIWLDFEKCCKEIKKEHLLKNMVKTNRYFFASKNVKELDLFFKLLPEEFRFEILRKSGEWTKTLINELDPKLIVCGGFKALERFKSLYPKHEHLDRGKNTEVINIEGKYLIAFKRNINALMADKKEFMNFLDKYTVNLPAGINVEEN